MHTFIPLIFLHENGYKFLAAADGGDDVRLVMQEFQNKIVRVGEREFDVTLGLSISDTALSDDERKKA